MAKKLINWRTKGMNRDTSPSAFSPEFAFENRNIRLSTNEGNTQMSWVNEKGTKKIKICSKENNKYKEKNFDFEIPVGTAIIDHKLVLFTYGNNFKENDCIYVLEFLTNEEKKECDYKYDLKIKTLFSGYLGLDPAYPLETLVSYESEIIQKVYWTDTKNPLRVINVVSDEEIVYDCQNYGGAVYTMFDFNPTLQLEETVTVEKNYGSGEFPSGVIQYAFTYYNKYMQESAIFYVTPLQYISYFDRGGSPEDTIANSFKITINKVDTNFEYLRIYSILRTSKNTMPLCKRVQDIEIKKADSGDTSIVFIDFGNQGETVDPTELLYKDGESIIVKTMEQKDGTLFLGNIIDKKLSIPDAIKKLFNIKDDSNSDKLKLSTKKRTYSSNDIEAYNLNNDTLKDGPYITIPPTVYMYENYYTKANINMNSIGISGFKNREYYRVGIQFQYKTGKWSEPIWIKDYQISASPEIEVKEKTVKANPDNPNDIGLYKEYYTYLKIPQIEFSISKDYTYKEDSSESEISVINSLLKIGYKKVRLLMAAPSNTDRTIITQGVANACLYKDSLRASEGGGSTLYGQPSWIFRPSCEDSSYLLKNGSDLPGNNNLGGYVPSSGEIIDLGGMESEGRRVKDQVLSPCIKSIEIGTLLYSREKDAVNEDHDDGPYKIDEELITINSPEDTDNSKLRVLDWTNKKINLVGLAHFDLTYGDMDIQTSSPTIENASGFIHKSVSTKGSAALVSGLFYEDYIVDDYDGNPVTYGKYKSMKLPVSFPVYMWHKNGSLNNDVQRDGQSAKLLKKKISNYHLSYSTSYYDTIDTSIIENSCIDYFSSEELSIIKLNGKVYMGNIDTLVTPVVACPKYFAGWHRRTERDTNIYSHANGRLGYNPKEVEDSTKDVGIYYAEGSITYSWRGDDVAIGNNVTGLCSTYEPVRIKYKSTPHIVALVEYNKIDTKVDNTEVKKSVPIFERIENSSLPIVEVVKDYSINDLYGGQSTDALKSNNWIPISKAISLKDTDNDGNLIITSDWGDTWYQRYECLKTYPFTSEDVNQVIDIASFMVETHVNIDGRYDRNKAQVSNLNVSPKNFNLINPVYSQLDNFFNYKLLDEDDYKNTTYPNQITWSKTKESGAVTDVWTNITLASVLEMDGDKGNVNKLAKLNNQLICFQDSGISQILYNENAQISTTAGVPIELANSGKVQGKRYYTNTIGCSNKWSVVQTPSGIYFMDSNDKGIYIFNGELKNITMAGGLNTWAKQNIPSADIEWNPVDFDNFISYYDAQNQEVLFINKKEALAFSEKFSCFTSFYDYSNAPYLCNLDDMSIWVKNGNNKSELWQHQAGKYCNFFGDNKGYSMTLIGNQEPTIDKIFTNLEFRACIEGEGTEIIENKTIDGEEKTITRYSPTLPFDSLEVWDEYQHGILNLSDRNGHDKFTHGNADGNASLNRKFRMWRCDIPRDNAPIDTATEASMGIKRFKVRSLDRMRNPWIYLKLEKKAAAENSFLSKVEIHDIVGTYFS